MDEPLLWLALVAVGLGGGFLSGLIGIGGGIVFAPALLVAFAAAGVTDPVLAPLTVGTSLFCTLAASGTSARAHLAAGRVEVRTALVAGGLGGVASLAVMVGATTQPWYSRDVFGAVLGVILLAVSARMLVASAAADRAGPAVSPRAVGVGTLAAIGGGAGAVAALAGVGGGVVFLPSFNGLLRMPLKRASGTTALAVSVVSAAGVAASMWLGRAAPVPPGALGYVGWQTALAIAVPALASARAGAWAAGRVDVRVVRITFAVLAAVVGVRLLWAIVG